MRRGEGETEYDKRCTQCGEIKLLKAFTGQKTGRKHRAAACKVCKSAIARVVNARYRTTVTGVPKRCSACGLTKDSMQAFAAKAANLDGRSYTCKECVRSGIKSNRGIQAELMKDTNVITLEEAHRRIAAMLDFREMEAT